MADTQVLIVGAGPVGLTLACDLMRHGIKVRVVDQSAEASVKSKALVVHSRSLELLDDMGIAARFVEKGFKLHDRLVRPAMVIVSSKPSNA